MSTGLSVALVQHAVHSSLVSIRHPNLAPYVYISNKKIPCLAYFAHPKSQDFSVIPDWRIFAFCVLNGLAHLHAHGIYNNPVSTSNLYVHKGQIVLSLWGISENQSNQEDLCGLGNVLINLYSRIDTAYFQDFTKKLLQSPISEFAEDLLAHKCFEGILNTGMYNDLLIPKTVSSKKRIPDMYNSQAEINLNKISPSTTAWAEFESSVFEQAQEKLKIFKCIPELHVPLWENGETGKSVLQEIEVVNFLDINNLDLTPRNFEEDNCDEKTMFIDLVKDFSNLSRIPEIYGPSKLQKIIRFFLNNPASPHVLTRFDDHLGKLILLFNGKDLWKIGHLENPDFLFTDET
jgi:serine/threonine protein kinase